MKKIISISLLSFLLLSSCSIDWNDEKAKTITIQDTKISKLEKQIEDYKKEKEDDLFKKNQECAKYKNDIIKDLSDPTFIISWQDPILEKIFYSNKRKSCLYSFRHYKIDNCVDDNKMSFEDNLKYCTKDKELVDFLTKEYIYSSTDYDKCIENFSKRENADLSICKTIEEKIEELKWE